jgi:DNA-binding transcriptional regulator LsrR (DeoR family)
MNFTPRPIPWGEGLGVRGGGGLLQRIENNLQHGFGLLQQVVVPEAQDADAEALKNSLALLVVGMLVGVLTAVELDG